MDRIDLVDRMILMELQKNSNQPLDQIAEAVGKSKTPRLVKNEKVGGKGYHQKIHCRRGFRKNWF